MLYTKVDSVKNPEDLRRETWCIEHRPKKSSRILIRHKDCNKIEEVTQLHFYGTYGHGQTYGINGDCWHCSHCNASLTGLALAGWSLDLTRKTPFERYLKPIDEVLRKELVGHADLRRRNYRWRLRLRSEGLKALGVVEIMYIPVRRRLRVFAYVSKEWRFEDYKDPKKAAQAALWTLHGKYEPKRVEHDTPYSW